MCEGNVLEYYYEDPERSDFHLYHRYTKSDTETAWMDTDPESYGETITFVSKMDGKWYRLDEVNAQETEISEAEAMAIIEQYPRIELDWKPVMDYPISETQTLRDYFTEKDVRVSNEELFQIYKDYLKKQDENGYMHYSHYRILDINGDGVDDRDQHMLVSVNSLPVEQWEKLYGEVWKSVIAAGTKAIMSGHISFPDYQGMRHDPDNALPATFCAKLQKELLREKLKFNGVIVSDAFPMVGFTCRYPNARKSPSPRTRRLKPRQNAIRRCVTRPRRSLTRVAICLPLP